MTLEEWIKDARICNKIDEHPTIDTAILIIEHLMKAVNDISRGAPDHYRNAEPSVECGWLMNCAREALEACEKEIKA